MSKGSGIDNQYSYTQNRELSWLRFNKRVLEEAMDQSVPLLERLKFISIFSTNLDEFFMIRVGSLFDISSIRDDYVDNKTGMSAEEQLESIYSVTQGLIEKKRRIYSSVCDQLEEHGVVDVPYKKLTFVEKEYVKRYFDMEILPILSPQVIDSRHPKPNFSSKGLYVASFVRDKNDKKSLAFTPVPDILPQIVMLGSSGRYIRIEEIILNRAPGLYGKFKEEESCVFSVTRNADVSFDSEKFDDSDTDFRNYVQKLLRKRQTLAVVRLEIDRSISDSFRKELMKMTDVEPRQVYIDKTPLNMKCIFEMIGKLQEQTRKNLSNTEYTPKWPADMSKDLSIMDQIRQKDRMLFFPFDSVDPFIMLLNEAADDPDVVSVKITIYRLASSSKIVRALCRAAENGKEVVAMMELRARFDEENNIGWSKMLEEAGCKVIYGIENFKCHSKICLITSYKRGRYSYITQIGTGNYNEKTNAMYTDISIMTANEEIGLDGTAFFRNMLTANLDGEYKSLLVAPKGIKSAICERIDRQIEKGAEGYVCMKVNSVTDREVIDKLAEASRAGVKIQMIVRGICCIRPGIPAETENLEVTSIVGRYLEHARIYCFGKGDDAELFISSADMMTRNLSRRVEIASPVYDEDIKRLLIDILNVQLKDNAKAGSMQPDGSYIRKCEGERYTLDSQLTFMNMTFHEDTPVTVQKEGFRGFIGRLFGRNKK